MMYFSPQATILHGADPSLWGLMATPRRGAGLIPSGYRWIADNGCFAGTWEERNWLDWLDGLIAHQQSCVMAVLPDVVADARATMDRYWQYLYPIQRRGWPIGLVAQDGFESLSWPDDYDALFIGGSTEWKLSDAADWCVHQAKAVGKWTHVGRVNGGKRIRHFKLIGVDSVDGTSICFAPSDEFRKLSNGLAYQPLFTLD